MQSCDSPQLYLPEARLFPEVGHPAAVTFTRTTQEREARTRRWRSGQEFLKEVFEDLHLLVSVSGRPLVAELWRGVKQTKGMKIKCDAALAFLHVLIGWDAEGDLQDIGFSRKYPSFLQSYD